MLVIAELLTIRWMSGLVWSQTVPPVGIETVGIAYHFLSLHVWH